MHPDNFKKLLPSIITAIALLSSWVSVATFGKDNVVELIARVVIQEVMKSEGICGVVTTK